MTTSRLRYPLMYSGHFASSSLLGLLLSVTGCQTDLEIGTRNDKIAASSYGAPAAYPTDNYDGEHECIKSQEEPSEWCQGACPEIEQRFEIDSPFPLAQVLPMDDGGVTLRFQNNFTRFPSNYGRLKVAEQVEDARGSLVRLAADGSTISRIYLSGTVSNSAITKTHDDQVLLVTEVTTGDARLMNMAKVDRDGNLSQQRELPFALSLSDLITLPDDGFALTARFMGGYPILDGFILAGSVVIQLDSELVATNVRSELANFSGPVLAQDSDVLVFGGLIDETKTQHTPTSGAFGLDAMLPWGIWVSGNTEGIPTLLERLLPSDQFYSSQLFGFYDSEKEPLAFTCELDSNDSSCHLSIRSLGKDGEWNTKKDFGQTRLRPGEVARVSLYNQLFVINSFDSSEALDLSISPEQEGISAELAGSGVAAFDLTSGEVLWVQHGGFPRFAVVDTHERLVVGGNTSISCEEQAERHPVERHHSWVRWSSPAPSELLEN